MQNKIWEQVGQFLNRLHCEDVTRDTAVEVYNVPYKVDTASERDWEISQSW
ncbi:hypothetical protein C823_005077 [Eubacterium plexicaudatum ASF492]|uniref:Uncharacterized protein n=1 Tax=Eubacterium plexicaudatum ASF492 TaxID=1235802 RepID=N1ZTA8_9FIRM|nr:hypothetical protein C823_005077 [Eubacterium plexicaudatum ASF492]